MRPHLFSPILATLLVVSATSLTAQRSAPVTLITGTVVGADGKPMSIADVHLGPAAEAGVVAEAKVGPDGRFAIATTQTGAFSLILTGVNNHSAPVPLLLDGRETTIALDVQLARYRYRDTLDPITAIGDWNHFNFDTGRPLVKQADGRYTLDVESTADTVAYQLLGLESDGRSINGTEGVRYQYDGGGDYRSVIKTDNGHATIVFDPRRLDRRPSERRITSEQPAGVLRGGVRTDERDSAREANQSVDAGEAVRAHRVRECRLAGPGSGLVSGDALPLSNLPSIERGRPVTPRAVPPSEARRESPRRLGGEVRRPWSSPVPAA